MAAAKTTNQTTSKSTKSKTTAKRKTNKKNEKKKSLTPFLLLVILLLLGFIAYTYRDKLQVVWQSAVTYTQSHREQSGKSDKEKHSDKKDNPLRQTISRLEKKSAVSTTTTTVRRQTTTTTVRKFTTTTTTTIRKPKVTTTTTTIRKAAATTTTTIRRAAVTTTTVTTVRPAAAVTTTTTVRASANVKPAVKTRTSKVYFTKVTMDDAYLVSAQRSVSYTDSPLTATINALLLGTNADEDTKYIVTNIPDGTRLLAAKISGSVAYLDFSAEFENNYFGKESTLYQLKQIVYTATEFQGVEAVQILINGRKQDYLGGEGILIGEPLRRTDFR